MPGICGIIGRDLEESAPDRLETMMRATLHESFYTCGSYTNNELGAYIGYSSLGGSFADCMPIWNPSRTLVMFVSGESYIDAGSLSELASSDPQLSPNDARFLIALYEQNPKQFFNELNGWLSGIILDLRRQKMVLFNDRSGVQRIYYHSAKDVFYFASEAKSLLAVLPETRAADFTSVGEYFRYDCVLENRTFFQDILLLPPGSAWEIADGQVHKRTYFDWRCWEDENPLSGSDFAAAVTETFDRILPRYFHGHRVGFALTGGFDTRMIMAGRNPRPGELPCYTFGSDGRETLDERIARDVAAVCKQPHQNLALPVKSYLADYSRHLERAIYISDALAWVDTPQILYHNRLAREVAPVQMNGKFGSQVFKNVLGFRDNPPPPAFIKADFWPYVSQAADTGAQLPRRHPLSFMLSAVIPWYWAGFSALQSSQLTVRSPFLDNDLLRILYRSPVKSLAFGTPMQWNYIRNHNAALAAIPTDKGFIRSKNPMAAYVSSSFVKALYLADRAYGSERFPFGLPRWVNRVDYWLSPLRVERRVFGFADCTRYRVWFRDQLAEFLRDTLLSTGSLSRPYWNAEDLKRIVSDHTSGHGNFLHTLRKVLHVEMMHRVLLERQWSDDVVASPRAACDERGHHQPANAVLSHHP